jgi:hypothetical protein
MNPDTIFQICGGLATVGWLLLIFGVRPRRLRPAFISSVSGGVIPLLLSAAYLVIILTHWPGHRGGFGSLSDVMLLFSNRWLVLAGWVHYLAFDLFIGSWQAAEAQKTRIPHLLLVPCLALTFLFGPIGWLCFYLLRAWHLRRGQIGFPAL